MRKAARAVIIKDNALLVMHRNKFGQEYDTLVGGGISPGETGEQAVVREVLEETGFRVTGVRPIFIEEAGAPYGTQYIYLCEAEGDVPQIAADSPEAPIHSMGQNLYIPKWLPLSELPNVTFRSPVLQKAILYSLTHGFPPQPVVIDQQFIDKVQMNIAQKGI